MRGESAPLVHRTSVPSPSRRRTPGLSALAGPVALGVALALAPVISPDLAPQASAQGSSNAPDHSAFYIPPAELPAEPGTVIRTEPMALFPSVPDLAGGGALPADARRIMYRSTGASGGPIAVTGTYLQPEAPWTGPGPRPLAIVTVIENFNPGDAAPAVPSMVLIGRTDDVIPYDTALDLTREWCAQGIPVQLHTSELPSIAPGFILNHGIPMVTETATGARYLKDRVLGLPAPSSCGTV